MNIPLNLGGLAGVISGSATDSFEDLICPQSYTIMGYISLLLTGVY